MRKRFSVLKILIALIFGFLPSFLFVVFFIQYGSPIQNYIKFFSDPSSAGAWISAIVVSLLVYFILGFVKPGATFRKIISNKPLFIGIIILIVLSFILIAVQLYLYVNFTLRNDILVQLSADRENIFFRGGFGENVSFKIDLIMNPFCSAECDYEFADLSYGGEVDSGKFNMTSILSKTKTYSLTNNKFVEGSQELKRFEVSCKSKKTWLCYTKGEDSRRAVLVTVNYRLSDDEKIFKNYSREDVLEMKKTFYSSSNNLKESFANLVIINGSFSTERFFYTFEELSNLSESLNFSLINLEKLWQSQDFGLLKSKLWEVNSRLNYLTNNSLALNSDINSSILFYNNLTELLLSSRNFLREVSQQNLAESDCNNLDNLISFFNESLIIFENSSNLSDKKIIVEAIYSEIENFRESYEINESNKCGLVNKLNSELPAKIFFISLSLPSRNFFLNDPEPICCLFGECQKCCDENCASQDYPIIFLHGQSINEAISVGYSLDAFSKMKEKLVLKGYIDAGAIILGSVSDKDSWGKMNATFIMTGSYFFDTYKTSTGEKTISSNQEGIDVYADRLRKLIELVKYKTGKNKVVLVSHSMGGVVTRRYIQLFGDSNVEKAILVTTPNHGVSDKVRDYCAVIGPEVSCEDLDKDSAFMKELNSYWNSKIPIYNFIGIGCDMGDETGEGVVKNSSQYLDSAINYYFTGTCNELNFEFFHEYIVDPEKYPKVYNKIYEILKNSVD